MSFIFGELDVADEVGIGYFFVFWDGVFGDKEDGIGPFNTFGGWRYLPPPCVRQKDYFVVKISKVDFSGPDRRVWREDLAPVMVSIATEAVEATRRVWLWQVCLVG